MTAERVLMPALYGAQLHRLAAWMTSSDITIAMYHGFTAATSHAGIENHELLRRFRQLDRRHSL